MVTFDPASHYRNVIRNARSRDVMTNGRIIASTDNVDTLLDKLTVRLIESELALGIAREEATTFLERFRDFLDRGLCILGTPLLTNISANRPTLASCSAVPFDASEMSSAVFETAEAYYQLNMGSGYNLDSVCNPVEALVALNWHAHRVEQSGICERYIGNIAHIGSTHPAIHDFITAKIDHANLKHFNISIDVDSAFMAAVKMGRTYSLRNDVRVDAITIWQKLVASAWTCGDPGIICLDRFNERNPIASVSRYITTAPCAEVGLSHGEACVFAYINLAACLHWQGSELVLNRELLGDVVECLTRVLDDSLQSGLNHFPTRTSNLVMSKNRKIGIGVCGFADALIWCGLDYGSDSSLDFIKEALSVINFRSKVASMNLARSRGSFSNFFASRYATERGYFDRFITHSVGICEGNWRSLERDISRYGLRNAITTALPPSGRTSLILGVSASIEPRLRRVPYGELPIPERRLLDDGYVGADHRGHLFAEAPNESSAWRNRGATSTSVFRNATELAVEEHMAVLIAASELVDDGVSKTINLPNSASVQDVEKIFSQAWNSGLKAISVYREPNEYR